MKLLLCLVSFVLLSASSELVQVPVNAQEVLLQAKTEAAQPVNELDRLEQQTQQLYETGRFAEASVLLQQLQGNYAVIEDKLGEARTLRNLALVYHATGERSKATEAIKQSFQHLQELQETRGKTKLFAQILEVQGQLQLSAGKLEEALETWKKAANTYKEIGDISGVTKTRINQAQTLQTLGLYRQAIKTLTEVREILQVQPDSPVKAKGLQSLGDALRVVGDLNQSQEVLQKSLGISERLQLGEAAAGTLLSLGNTARVQEKSDESLEFYQRAVTASSSVEIQVEAQLNQLSLLIEEDRSADAQNLISEIQSKIINLPPSRPTIYAQINLARSLMKMGNATTEGTRNAAEILATAVQQAQSLEDKRAEAYALGNLGRVYEQNRQWKEGKSLTEKALLLAQSINASDITYQWHWQMGRILKEQGNREGAIAAYSQSVSTLQSLRNDLVAINSDVQFSFRESVEPVYRELVGLLLQPAANVEQSALIQARQVIESLQLAELDNFFRDACLDVKPIQIDQVDSNAAVFYTIILKERLEVILALPGQPLKHYTTQLPQETVEATLKELRDTITNPRMQLSIKRFLTPSQKVYDWLIRPIEAELAGSGVNTLVFVLDGGFRNIPIAALYDGEQYLVQKYSVALTPGLQLLEANPLARENLNILAAGLTEARQGFSSLPHVESELDQIQVEASTKILLNESFSKFNFEKNVQSIPFSVVHLATHGEFSSQAKDTFILTWDGQINAKELDSLLRSETGQNKPIELLVLSACKTAAGDNRAALGLAGVAVRAGARSTVASLWYVSDEATAVLMTEFYQELANSKVTKAEALRRAQEAVLLNEKLSHPYFWAAFVMVGNWL
ncbi:CHAT domain-containing protein [Microcoleus sp. FACHB-672]|uniref:CHAT domain-containing protein n=1 Tax=Microcoleus sp. FACHB-672 TaxID=2692825 RepID=UPI001688FC37|nr:CHAT domain-containing protein [Microcoleus sp. FACHB-672]MBD2042911.1 CHAT domain-containing protein [Microcoleus sp. FACHB-672]